MQFDNTPEEARYPAKVVASHLRRQRMRIRVERAAWEDAPYRTTLVALKGGRTVLVEAQGVLSYSRSLKELATWIATRRLYAELFIATVEDAVLSAGTLYEMGRDGVGLFVVDADGSVIEQQRARNHALVVTPDPTLKLGPVRHHVQSALDKFNSSDRKDGLRDMCEIVEGLTGQLGAALADRKWIKTPKEAFQKKDWASQINDLARPEVYEGGRAPVFDQGLKDDMHSFRGARNLVDHSARTRRDDARRQRQFAERMMQGPRLAAELVALKRKVQ